MIRLFSPGRLTGALGAAAILSIMPTLANDASAQTSRVYTADELSEAPALASPRRAAAAIERSYPRRLKQQGVQGTVELRFIVEADGSVDANSIEVVAATHDRLGDAARRAITRVRFTPGKVDGNAVRTEILIPLTYQIRG